MDQYFILLNAKMLDGKLRPVVAPIIDSQLILRYLTGKVTNIIRVHPVGTVNVKFFIVIYVLSRF